jgi:hypothetical protein
MLLQVDLHRHLTGSLPNGRVLDILAETTSAKDDLVPTSVCGAASPQPPPPPPMVTPDQGVSAAAQHDAWDLLIRQCAAVQTASASSDDNFRRLVTEAVEELARDNVVCAEPPISSTLSCALHCILLQEELARDTVCVRTATHLLGSFLCFVSTPLLFLVNITTTHGSLSRHPHDSQSQPFLTSCQKHPRIGTMRC